MFKNNFDPIFGIEKFMKWLSDLGSEQNPSESFVLLITSLAVLYWASRDKGRGHYKALDELGIFSTSGRGRIKEFPEYIEIKNIKQGLGESSYWRNKFEVFGNIFEDKFIDVKIGPGATVKLYRDRLPEFVPSINCPELRPMEAWLGKNQFGEDVVINLQDNSSMYVDGKAGSGKTTAVKAVIDGFISGVSTKVNLVIVTTKPVDYYLYEKNKDVNLTLIDPFEGDFCEQVEKVLEVFQKIKDLEVEFKLSIKEKNVSEVTNLGELRAKGICATSLNQIIIFDEGKDYLSKSKADQKKEAQIKLELVTAVQGHMRRTARFLSIPIIVASHTQSESDLDIPLKSFHLRLASNTNEAMSRIITGSNLLCDNSFKKGKFFISRDEQDNILKIAQKN